jgi:hypothetical protein
MFNPNDLLFLAPDFAWLAGARGGFARRVLVVLRTDPEFPGGEAFTARILASARLDLERDVLLAGIGPEEPFSLLPALKEKHPEYVLVFGFTPAECGLHLDLPCYRPTPFYQTNLLFADRLAVLEPDKDRKGQLWQALKQWFL